MNEWTSWHERHADKITLVAGVDCWIWVGATGAGGYGRVKYGPSSEGAHKAAFLEAGGALKPREVVRHKCGNRYCVRPGHLLAGSHADNAKDTSLMFQSTSKLIERDIIAIRTAYRSGTSLADIAKAHDIAYGTVFPIVNGKSFRHIAPELITKQGSRCPRKLSADDVAAIRSALSSGQQSQAVIAKKYGVGSGLVSRIKTGHRHKLQTSTQDQLL